MKLTRLVNICSGNWIYISNFSLPGAHPGSLFAICAPDIIFCHNTHPNLLL